LPSRQVSPLWKRFTCRRDADLLASAPLQLSKIP
jgi:hypothetical protein